MEKRDWGYFDVILEEKRYKVKKLVVLPEKELSYQYHFHRSEVWTVVQGTAEVKLNGMEQLLKEGESIFIGQLDLHQLKNPGKIKLVVIEVQYGSYLEEDDIERLN